MSWHITCEVCVCVCVSLQDLQNSLSSQGSPSISPAPFGSHMTTSSGAEANSPALSQNSAPSSTPNGHSFHPGSGSGSLARQLARPAELDRVSSGYLEPGELLLLKSVAMPVVAVQLLCPVARKHPISCAGKKSCLRAIDSIKAFVDSTTA